MFDFLKTKFTKILEKQAWKFPKVFTKILEEYS
jgi:hypothetical protein